MVSETVVELSRWQSIITVMAHFVFLPLTLGLSCFLTLLESAYVLTGQDFYKTACQFWGRIFVINFLLGFASRLTLIAQFGTNNSYFSHYVGDVFALPLAIEALTSFFLASTLFGAYLLGWNRFSKRQHLLITYLLWLTVSLSTWWIVTAYCWMQNPVGASFNYQSYRVELNDFYQFLSNPTIFSKFIHTTAAMYTTAAATVLGISSRLLLQNPEDKSAFHAYKWAAILGLSGSLLLCIGDNTPASDQLVQSRKLAALNGDQANQRLPDIEAHIRTGIKAYNLLQMLRDDDKNPTLLSDFNHMKQDLGYALLMQRWTAHIDQADDKQISLAAKFCSPPNPTVIYWGYRFMLASAILSLVIFCLAGWRSIGQNRPQVWLMKTAYYLLPAPWLACMSGWFVSEAGKQPWAIAGILPSFLSNSSLTVSELLMSLSTSTIAYILLLAVFFYLMRENISRHISAQGTLT